MIEAYALYSGSSGNAYLLRCGETSILVDAGRSAAALCRALRAAGVEPESVSAVLVTHEHRDHVSALRVFSGVSASRWMVRISAPALQKSST